MKDEINLLPPSAMAMRKEYILKRREGAMFMAIAISCILVLGTYAGIWWQLRGIRNSFEDQITMQNKDRIEIIEQNKAFNQDVAAIDSRIAGFTLWTSRIPDVVAAAPEGIFINRIELVENPAKLVVACRASRGSSVVEYQAALEKLSWVDHVDAPLQNFARAPEVIAEFTIFHKEPAPL